MVKKLGNCLPAVFLLIGMFLAAEDANARSGRSSSRSSSVSSGPSASTAKKSRDDEAGAGRNVNVVIRNGTSSLPPTGAQSPGFAGTQGAAAAAVVGATAGSAASKPIESPEEARERIARRNEQLMAEQEARERAAIEQREANQRLVEKAQRDRERQTAEEEQRRTARRQSALSIVQAQRSSCVIKPVMTQAEIDACK